MKRFVCSLICLVSLSAFAPGISAQTPEFALAPGRAGEAYRQNLLQTLRNMYGVSIAGGSQRASLSWSSLGALPAGLELDAADGGVSGTPEQAGLYKFRVRVEDASAPRAEPLELAFTLRVLAARVQLIKDDSLRLVAAGEANAHSRIARRGGRRAAALNPVAAAYLSPRSVRGDSAGETVNAASSNLALENAACQDIEIRAAEETAEKSPSLTFVVKKNSIKTLELTLRTAAKSSIGDRIPITWSSGATQVRISKPVKLIPGQINNIYVTGLDTDLNVVGCGSYVITSKATASDSDSESAASEAVKVVPPQPPGTVSLALTPRVATKVPKSSEIPLKVVLYGTPGIFKDIYVRIVDGGGIPVHEGPLTIPSPPARAPGAAGRQQNPDEWQIVERNVKIGFGHNVVTVLGRDALGKIVNEDTTVVTCQEKNCGSKESSELPYLRVEAPFEVARQSDYEVMVTVHQPEAKVVEGDEAKNAEERKRVEREKIKEIHYQVFNVDNDVIDYGEVGVDENAKIQPVVVGLREGANRITVSGRNKGGDKNTEEVSTNIECRNCSGPSNRVLGNSIYTRAIFGFEQVGSSSSSSTQKPFLDFFVAAPIGRKASEITPRLSLWGSARIASFPLEGGALGINEFATGFANTAAGIKTDRLAQGFDFLAGVDVRIIPRNDNGYLSLIPGTRQRSSLSLIASFGAISALTPPTQTAQLFAIPISNGKVDPNFLAIFPELTDPANAGKTNIAFVTPNRDRFFRQYYIGVRVKTFFFDRRDQIINRFPAIFDFSFGQNELVTGYLRNVLRFEGFYPFPFKDASFFYLYATALMKAGRSGGRINLPVFLNPAGTDAKIADPTTLVVSVEKNPELRTTRDNYRLGVGIDLIGLINRIRNTTTTPR